MPSAILGLLHIVHFNWSTHNAFSPAHDFKPVNIDVGYYRIGNWLWHGIYMHANHHKRTNLFNPSRMKNGAPLITPGE